MSTVAIIMTTTAITATVAAISRIRTDRTIDGTTIITITTTIPITATATPEVMEQIVQRYAENSIDSKTDHMVTAACTNTSALCVVTQNMVHTHVLARVKRMIRRNQADSSL